MNTRRIPRFVLSCLVATACWGQSNGITVEKGKIFDNRSLVLMTDELERRLRQMGGVDQQSLTKALGTVSGIRSEETSRSLTISGLPTSVNTERGSTTAGGTTASPTVVTPQPQSTFDQPNTQFKIPDASLNAQDLLTEQINLNYQLFNLRMLLERSLSDRLIQNEARLQGVLGFQISVDPPKGKDGYAAYAEMKITFDGAEGPSLVAALPQEKTYNVAALSRESNAFGGAAVIKVVTVGYSERRRGEKYFLYQDADTEVFRKPSANAKEMILGWSFRPVLGRKTVSPGLRQVFAVISVPAKAGSTGPHPIRIDTRTYWRRYDSKKLTLGNEEAIDPHGAYSVDVTTPDQAESGLASKVTKARWVVTGDKSAVVLIDGENFFDGTSVVMGGQTHSDPATGLQIKSDKALQVDPAPWLGADVITLLIQLTKPGGKDLPITDVEGKSSPIISVGGKTFMGTAPTPTSCDGYGKDGKPLKMVRCVQYAIPLSATLLASANDLVIRWPFYGPRWTARERLSPVTTEIKAVVLGKIENHGQTMKRLGITGTEFSDDWIVVGDKDYSARSGLKVSPSLITVEIPANILDALDTVVVQNPKRGYSFVLPLPKSKPDPVAVSLKTASPDSVPTGFAGSVEFSGTGLSRIKKILFGSDELVFSLSKDKVSVAISRKVSEKEGAVALVVVLDDDSKQFAQFTIKDPAKTASAK